MVSADKKCAVSVIQENIKFAWANVSTLICPQSKVQNGTSKFIKSNHLYPSEACYAFPIYLYGISDSRCAVLQFALKMAKC